MGKTKRCQGTTRAGRRCKKPAVDGSRFCRTPHPGAETPPAPAPQTALAALEEELRALAKLVSGVDRSSLAMAARALARDIDNSETTPASRSMCIRTLQSTLEQLDVFGRLRTDVPPPTADDDKEKPDRVDELGRLRAERRGQPAT